MKILIYVYSVIMMYNVFSRIHVLLWWWSCLFKQWLFSIYQGNYYNAFMFRSVVKCQYV